MTTNQQANKIVTELHEAGFDYDGMKRTLYIARERLHEMRMQDTIKNESTNINLK